MFQAVLVTVPKRLIREVPIVLDQIKETDHKV